MAWVRLASGYEGGYSPLACRVRVALPLPHPPLPRVSWSEAEDVGGGVPQSRVCQGPADIQDTTSARGSQASLDSEEWAVMAVVGYARVSTADQNLDRQLAALEARGCERVFQEKASGARADGREALAELRDWVREGDVVCVLTLDRLGRSVRDVLRIMDDFEARGVSVEFLSQPMLNTSEDNPMSSAIRVLMATFAELELSFIRERQRQGIKAAKARGVYERGPAMSPAQVAEAERLVALGVPKSQVARSLGFARATIYRALGREGLYSGPAYQSLPAPSDGAAAA